MSTKLRQLGAFAAGLGVAFWAASFLAGPGARPAVREAFVYPMFAGAAVLALLSLSWRKAERQQERELDNVYDVLRGIASCASGPGQVDPSAWIDHIAEVADKALAERKARRGGS